MAALDKSFCLFFLLFIMVVRCSPRLYDYSDMILVARCESKCSNLEIDPSKHLCLQECEGLEWEKPGNCSGNDIDSHLCMPICDVDSQCPGIDKCCQISCGTICSPAQNLEKYSDLPPIPSNITYHENKRGTSVNIHWKDIDNFPNVRYVVQERHHIGVHYKKERLGDWSTGFITEKNKLSKKYIFIPGRWYQVRVASVNVNGFRGYSEPSEPFTLSLQPNPPGMPRNLTIESVNLVNNKYWVELHWEPPLSELPINKYKIYWSRFLKDGNLNETSDKSVITQHEAISAEQNHFSIPDLDPRKLCFIRIQAISLFGTRRLKGDQMATIVFRPIEYTDASTLSLPNITTNKRRKKLGIKKKINDLKVERFYTLRNELFAKLTWSGINIDSTDHFTITWSRNEPANLLKDVFTASTDTRWYTIHGLKYKCKYKITVKTYHHRILYSSFITFTTPSSTDNLDKNIQTFS